MEWGDIGLSQVSRETTQTNKPPKHYTKTEAITSKVLLKEKRKHKQWISATIRVKSSKRRLTSIDLKAKVVRLLDEWQVTIRSTAYLDCLLSK